MIRGRHRGLPVAIDRAVLLPEEFRPDYDLNTKSQGGISPYPRSGHNDGISGNENAFELRRRGRKGLASPSEEDIETRISPPDVP